MLPEMHIVTLQETDDSHQQVYFFPTLFLLYLGWILS